MSQESPEAARKLALSDKYARKLNTLKSKEARRKAVNKMKKFKRQADNS
ncbi:hypothetical protein NA78x_005101 [Anatilimnocola sp. NA78]